MSAAPENNRPSSSHRKDHRSQDSHRPPQPAGAALQRPVKLAPVAVDRVWGGRAVNGRFGWEQDPRRVIGEWWLLSFRKDHSSTILEGPLAGLTLKQAIARHPALLGTQAPPDLLIKILDARQTLSVQVHPDRATANALNEAVGKKLYEAKTECWYFLDSGLDPKIYLGLQEDRRAEDFLECVRRNPPPGEVEPFLHAVAVQEGDLALIPAGTIHAVGAGALILEIQQSSDTTFRIYDWGRDRQLHLDEAEQAMLPGPPPPIGRLPQSRSGTLLSCDYFCLDRWLLEDGDGLPIPSRLYSFAMVLNGEGRLETGTDQSMFQPGDAYFIPAEAASTRIRTKSKVTMIVARQSAPLARVDES